MKPSGRLAKTNLQVLTGLLPLFRLLQLFLLIYCRKLKLASSASSDSKWLNIFFQGFQVLFCQTSATMEFSSTTVKSPCHKWTKAMILYIALTITTHPQIPISNCFQFTSCLYKDGGMQQWHFPFPPCIIVMKLVHRFFSFYCSKKTLNRHLLSKIFMKKYKRKIKHGGET